MHWNGKPCSVCTTPSSDFGRFYEEREGERKVQKSNAGPAIACQKLNWAKYSPWDQIHLFQVLTSSLVMWRKLAEMTANIRLSTDSSVPSLLIRLSHNPSLARSHLHEPWLLSSMSVRDKHTLVYFKRQSIPKASIDSNCNINWTWNANLKLEMSVVHSFWNNKWLWLPLLLSFFICPHTDRCWALQPLLRDRTTPMCPCSETELPWDMREDEYALLAPHSLPQPTPVFSPLPERSLRLPHSLAATVIGT